MMMMRIAFALAVLCTLYTASEAKKPNVLFILTDDQDSLLDSLQAMPKLQKLVGEEGTTFSNMFATTPVCCPSRSSFMTGNYINSIHVRDNSIAGNCSSSAWQSGPETKNVATYMKTNGYRTHFAGKYLNAYGFPQVGGPKHIPPGWDNWMGLVGNSIYYGYVLSNNGKPEAHGRDYATDYLPDLILNRTLDFLDEHFEGHSDDPFFAYVSTPSCHQPADPAPQYADELEGVKAPRTPNWNVQAHDHHWFVREAGIYGPLDSNQVEYSDLLYRRRLLTLKSVDDLVESLINKLDAAGELDNTYIFFTSDHGFHLGQFGLTLDKRLPYETDIRVPMFVRGPGVAKGAVSEDVILNIDMAPTFISISGGSVPDHMDGEPIDLSATTQSRLSEDSDKNDSPNDKRVDFLIEYYGESNNGGGSSVCGYLPEMNCYSEGTFRTPPYFDGSAFCSCEDSLNNTYTCVRSFAPPTTQLPPPSTTPFPSSHKDWFVGAPSTPKGSYLYCEFAGGESEYFELSSDPWEVKNQVNSLSKDQEQALKNRMSQLLKDSHSRPSSNSKLSTVAASLN